MWILDQYKNELVHVERSREIFIVDSLDIELSSNRYDTNKGCRLLGSYSSAGRAREVFEQLTDWVATGAQGVFRMPRE